MTSLSVNVNIYRYTGTIVQMHCDRNNAQPKTTNFTAGTVTIHKKLLLRLKSHQRKEVRIFKRVVVIRNKTGKQENARKKTFALTFSVKNHVQPHTDNRLKIEQAVTIARKMVPTRASVNDYL